MDAEQRIEKQEAFADDARQRLARIEEYLKHTATKSDIAELRTDIYKLEVRMVKWFIFTAFAMTSVMGGIAVAAMKLIH